MCYCQTQERIWMNMENGETQWFACEEVGNEWHIPVKDPFSCGLMEITLGNTCLHRPIALACCNAYP